MRGEADRQLYVFALSTPGLPRRLTVLGRRLEVLRFGKVEAIVSASYRPEPDTDHVKAQHEIVSRLSGRVRALLPARFGSLVTEQSLRSLVASRGPELLAALKRVRGCDQMTIRIFGAPDRAPTPVEDSRSGADYLRDRRARAHREPSEAVLVRREMTAVVEAERSEPGHGALRVTIYHLVRRTRLAAYRRRASALQASLAPHTVKVTGPWPVFAFAPELL